MAKAKQDPEWYKAYYAANRERLLAGKAIRYAKKRTEIIDYNKKLYQDKKAIILAQCKKRYAENAEEKRKYARRWRLAHPGHHSRYKMARMQTDVQFALVVTLRSRLNIAIRKSCKAGSAVKLLGCSVDSLKSYLESLFRPGMDWSNWSFDGWHIDHKKPLSSFDLTDPEQLAEACHFSNLQPLWAAENMAKGNRIAA